MVIIMNLRKILAGLEGIKAKGNVDIDIKGFFDNVNHEKLIKQIWNLGIQDKQLICIIGKMQSTFL